MFPPGYVPDWPRLAAWDSDYTAFTYMGLSVVMTLAVLRNLIFFAKTKHTKAVYLYLMFWCLFRLAAFAMRGYMLVDSHGQSLDTYKSTQIVLSIGFMPLAEVLTFNVAEASTLIYELSHRTYIRLRILIMICFVVFGTAVTAFVIDFTLNKPFGSNAKDFSIDLILREIGFNGLFLIVIYTFFASIRNALAITSKKHIPEQHVARMRQMMWIVCFQSFLMIVKLCYITYRNWNPAELRDERWWYLVSISPEFLYMLFFVSHRFMDVYDDVELIVGEDGNHVGGNSGGATAVALEEGRKEDWMTSSVSVGDKEQV
ncbi:UNVERIFIED_CONTAM: hypothetical protein HDU68_005418 [Siphonaria sp. JEL0065]|nr:hypothetical protein HDU68_005418 [Siphonaria sp. JEL0065]